MENLELETSLLYYLIHSTDDIEEFKTVMCNKCDNTYYYHLSDLQLFVEKPLRFPLEGIFENSRIIGYKYNNLQELHYEIGVKCKCGKLHILEEGTLLYNSFFDIKRKKISRKDNELYFNHLYDVCNYKYIEKIKNKVIYIK